MRSSKKKKRTYLSFEARNTIKNFSIAFFKFVLKEKKEDTKRVADRLDISLVHLLAYIRRMKNSLQSIVKLRRMWEGDANGNKYCKAMRILSFEFLRKRAIPYYMNSNIKHLGTNLKCLKALLYGVRNPSEFRNMKSRY